MKLLCLWPLLYFSILSGCAFKSGFGGESKTEVGSVSFVDCGNELRPDLKARKLNKVYFIAGNINHDSLVAEPNEFKARLIKGIHGKCTLLEKSDSLNLKQGEGFVGFDKVIVNNRAPFSHLGDKEECFRAEGTVLLGLVDTTIYFRFSFQNTRNYFDENIFEWVRDQCK